MTAGMEPGREADLEGLEVVVGPLGALVLTPDEWKELQAMHRELLEGLKGPGGRR